jgi:membrane protein
MSMRLSKNLGKAFSAAGRKMLSYETPRDAAGISYFGLLALFPSILVLIGLVDAFLGWMNLHRTVIQKTIALFPGSRQFLNANLNEIMNPSTAIVLSCVVVLLWSSSLIFAFIEDAINRAWGVPHQKSFWENRLRGFSFMVLGGASLLISSILTVIVSAMQNRASASMPTPFKSSSFIGWFWYLILLGTGLLIAVLVFTLLYKITPHCKVLWNEAVAGAVVTTILWEVGSWLFVKLMPFFYSPMVYGRMGAMIVLLAWVYTSSMIMLFGANFSAQLHAAADKKCLQESDDLQHDNISRFPSHYNRR